MAKTAVPASWNTNTFWNIAVSYYNIKCLKHTVHSDCQFCCANHTRQWNSEKLSSIKVQTGQILFVLMPSPYAYPYLSAQLADCGFATAVKNYVDAVWILNFSSRLLAVVIPNLHWQAPSGNPLQISSSQFFFPVQPPVQEVMLYPNLHHRQYLLSTGGKLLIVSLLVMWKWSFNDTPSASPAVPLHII